MFAYFLIKKTMNGMHIECVCVCCGWWTWWGKATISSVYDDDVYLRTQRTLNQFSNHQQSFSIFNFNSVFFCYHVQKSEKESKETQKEKEREKNE